jgi:hypothetical protein
MRNKWISLVAAIGLTFALTSQASAAGPLELGDRMAITANFSVSTIDPDELPETTVLTLASTITKSTADARWEYGGGFFLTAVLTDVADVTTFTPNVQIRINTDLLGPEENILAYVGFIAGVTFLDVDTDFGDFSDEVGSFGPKFGAEYYFSSNIAIQLEDSVLIDTDSGVTNTLMLGAKLLF